MQVNPRQCINEMHATSFIQTNNPSFFVRVTVDLLFHLIHFIFSTKKQTEKTNCRLTDKTVFVSYDLISSKISSLGILAKTVSIKIKKCHNLIYIWYTYHGISFEIFFLFLNYCSKYYPTVLYPNNPFEKTALNSSFAFFKVDL